MSEAVVRVEVGPSQEFKTRDGDCRVHEVRALEVFKGPITVGQSFRVTGLDTYYHAPGIRGLQDSWDPIQQGESLYLFLVTNGTLGYSMYRLTDADWTVIESGARLVHGRWVYSFVQPLSLPFDSTGRRPHGPACHGHAAMTEALVPGARVLRRDAFVARLRRSLQMAARVSRGLAESASADRFDQLAALLRSRADVLQEEMVSDDHLGVLLAQRLIELAERPEQLMELRSRASRRVVAVLDRALLRWPSYLLDRIRDRQEPLQRRLEWASRLGDALSIGDDADELPRDLLIQIARLAVQSLGTELALPLLQSIASLGVHAHRDTFARDVRPALSVLTKAFPGAAPSDQFHIAEVLLKIGGAPYRDLLPHAGPFLTYIAPAGGFSDGLARRELQLVCSFRNQLTTRSELTVVLQPTAGGPEFEIPLESRLEELTNTCGSAWEIRASVADYVPPGRYSVFLRARQGALPRGDGLGFEIDLPPR